MNRSIATSILSFSILLHSELSISNEVNFEAEIISNSNVIIGDNNSINNNISIPSSKVELYSKFIDPLTSNNSRFLNADIATPIYKEYEDGKIYPFFAGLANGEDYFYNYFTGRNLAAIDSMQYFSYKDIAVSLPFYEVRVVNNTNKSISIDKITLNVKNSITYKSPVVTFLTSEWELGRLLVKNERDQKINNIKIKYNIGKSFSKTSNDFKYITDATWDSKSGLYEIDLKDPLKQEGIDIDFLRSTIDFASDNEFIYPHIKPLETKKALGSYSSQLSDEHWNQLLNHNKNVNYDQFQAYIKGEYAVEGEYNGEKTFKSGIFSAAIPLTAIYFHALGDIETSIIKNAIFFKTEGKNYPIDIEMSKFIKPFDSERYFILLDSNDTSTHSFYPSITLSDGEIIQSKEQNLILLKDKSQKNSLLVKSAYYKVINVKNNDFLAMRDKADRQAAIVQKIPYDAKNIEMLDARIFLESATWVKVKYNDQEGWINSKYITIMNNEKF